MEVQMTKKGDLKRGEKSGLGYPQQYDPKPRKEPEMYPEAILKEKRDDPNDSAEDLDVASVKSEGGGQQNSGKVGKKSSGQKMADARYKAGPMPAAKHVSGAFGREPTAKDFGTPKRRAK
jgi:hypothetical protein